MDNKMSTGVSLIMPLNKNFMICSFPASRCEQMWINKSRGLQVARLVAERLKKFTQRLNVQIGTSNGASVREIDKPDIGSSFCNFYSCGQVDDPNLPTGDRVIRISAVHNNSIEQIDRSSAALESLHT